MLEAVKAQFSDRLDTDDREPVYGPFSIPGLEGSFALYQPKGELWKQLVLVQLLQTGFQVLFALAIYTFIVKPRQLQQEEQSKKDDDKSKATTTSSSTIPLLIGYGIVMPLALYIPFAMMEYLMVVNASVRLAFGTLPAVVCFRTIEAMHGTSPVAVEHSLSNYVTYYTCLSHFEWSAETKERRKTTARELLINIGRVIYFFTGCSLWMSFMMHFRFQPMASTSVQLDGFQLSWDLLSVAHLVNVYCLAVLVYLTLAMGMELTAFGEQIKGYSVKPIFDNPLFESRSIREFWGKRWDLMIHRILKHGAFLPARQVFSAYGSTMSNLLGTVAAFFASGLLHEYSWAIIFYDLGDDPTRAYSPLPLKLTLFFLYNCGTMMIEHHFGRHITFFESWPSIIVSTLVVLTALPLSHWYSGDWVVGGYFDDLSLGLWHIKKIDG
mmetsp:Transcript_249/g.742  ORF Transcript_249/g.742 Transcript_249/m.742 type:complete len:438 (-) Transcript_249:168-1481(-)